MNKISLGALTALLLSCLGTMLFTQVPVKAESQHFAREIAIAFDLHSAHTQEHFYIVEGMDAMASSIQHIDKAKGMDETAHLNHLHHNKHMLQMAHLNHHGETAEHVTEMAHLSQHLHVTEDHYQEA